MVEMNEETQVVRANEGGRGMSTGSVDSRSDQTVPSTARSGALKPPGELGFAITRSEEAKDQQHTCSDSLIHPNTLLARKEKEESIERNRRAQIALPPPRPCGACSLVTAFSYEGMQGVVATCNNHCYLVCPQTNYLYQELSLISDKSTIALVSCDETGLIVIAHCDGQIQTYLPKPTDDKTDSFAKFHWWNYALYDCSDIFSCNLFESSLVVSVSHNYRILVAHEEQLAVLDVNPASSVVEMDHEAEILWTTRLPSHVEAARISGDSNSIAVVLQRINDDDDSGSDGVHTFQRDWDDGGALETHSSLSDIKVRPSMAVRASSVGILYKPGPFLIHGAPVTHLSFRGLGHAADQTSGVSNGGDLLLTYSQLESTARIFAQDGWNELVDWETPNNTRVEWVRGVTACTLGDLESGQPKASSQGSMKRNTSDDDLYETVGRQSSPQQLPGHPLPYSSAGAWVSEITFKGNHSFIRLSRLTYLQRGMEEAHATLFECSSATLPPNTLFPYGLLNATNYGLVVQAVWPAWNPWLSESTQNPNTTETLRGSAMSFLGLAGVSGSPGGQFGEPTLGSTQSPPIELRMTCTHPIGGLVALLSFRLRGDFTSIDVDLPRKTVLSLTDLLCYDRRDKNEKPARDMLPSVSVQHGRSRLIARESQLLHGNIEVIWTRPGLTSFLPLGWTPQDVPETAAVLARANEFQDETLLAVPVVQSFYEMPPQLRKESVLDLIWWETTEPKYGGASFLVVLTSSGSIAVFQVPSPHFINEVSAQSNDFYASGVEEEDVMSSNSSRSAKGIAAVDYEVTITPDPDHGLGLRLESKPDGSCAIAGSFKRHPLNDEMLPAEKASIIKLGDELISANNVNLENQAFDDIIAQVRRIGGAVGPGNGIILRFRSQKQEDFFQTSDSMGGRSFNETFEARSLEGVNGDWSRGDHGLSNETLPPSLVGLVQRCLGVDDRPSQRNQALIMPFRASKHALNAHRRSLLLLLSTSGLNAYVLSLADKLQVEGSDMNKVGSFVLGQGIEPGCWSISVLECSTDNSLSVAVTHDGGKISLIRVSLFDGDKDGSQATVSFTRYATINLGPDLSTMRGCSSSLFASMSDKNGNGQDLIKLHYFMASPSFTDASLSDGLPAGPFLCEELHVQEEVIDFVFLPSGSLDPTPMLLVFSVTSLYLFARRGGSVQWSRELRFVFTSIKGSREDSAYSRYAIRHTASAFDAFPHLMSDIFMIYRSPDEESYLLSDWHPLSVIATVCCGADSVTSCLRDHVPSLFKWLNSEDSCMDYMNGSRLPCAPSSCQRIGTDRSSLAAGTKDGDNCISSLVPVLEEHLKRRMSPESYEGTRLGFLKGLDVEDEVMLLSIFRLALNQPNFASLDRYGQLYVFASSLLREVELNRDSFSSMRPTTPVSDFTPTMSVESSQAADGKGATIASSASLAALVCDEQDRLLDVCRKTNAGLSWETVKKNRIPFWLRSDGALAKVAEEVGQTIFRRDRDIMDCALFFIVSGKLRTLRNLAATDQSDTGRKLYKFLTSHDFSSRRGRVAAEKNAFSLLRKNKYRPATAFFLLGQPPSLKSAVETILSKTEDIDLAFMILRLMENKQIHASSTSKFSLVGLGGGGGFAGTPEQMSSSVEKQAFRDWIPNLSMLSRNFLCDRFIPFMSHDHILTAQTLFWLEEQNVAAWLASGTVGLQVGNGAILGLNHSKRSQAPRHQTDSVTRVSDRHPMVRANELMDLVSIPSMLRDVGFLGSPLCAASLSMTESLVAMGLEVQGLRSILDSFSGAAETGRSSPPPKDPKPQVQTHLSGAMQSSIFDSFDGPPASAKSKSTASSSGGMNSSIFDSFDGPPASAKPKVAASSSGAMNSSIFDSFDGPSSGSRSQANGFHPAQFVGSKAETPGEKAAGVDPCDTLLHLRRLGKGLDMRIPPLWREVRHEVICVAAGRRLIREVSRILAQFQGDPSVPSIKDFVEQDLLIPHGISNVLQLPCDANSIILQVRNALTTLAEFSKISEDALVHRALRILGETHSNRLLFEVVLQCSAFRVDLAEGATQSTAQSMIRRSFSFVCANMAKLGKTTRFQSSTQFERRHSARLSWQLESCLWLHRGDGLPLSTSVLKEMICAVRIGLLMASWRSSCDCIQAIVQTPPDCPVDDDAGRLLWTTLGSKEAALRQTAEKKVTSGGWEFLVDCKRAQATSMLKDKPTGCFIIRPHSQDHGVFTLSFKTNLVPTDDEFDSDETGENNETPGDEAEDAEVAKRRTQPSRSVKKSDVVQHAIIRLSDSGFRCGSFGPFTSLISLLEAVSSSLPFKLRFDRPPANHLIQDEGSQTSPNAVLFRKLSLRNAESFMASFRSIESGKSLDGSSVSGAANFEPTATVSDTLGAFVDLLSLSSVCRQLCGLVIPEENDSAYLQDAEANDSGGSVKLLSPESHLHDAFRILGPFLLWCRAAEILVGNTLVPHHVGGHIRPLASSVDVSESAEAIEVSTFEHKDNLPLKGDAVLRRLIQQGTGIEFSTLRLVDGGECTMVVLFKRADAVRWLVANGVDASDKDASWRLHEMETSRFIEAVDLSTLQLKQKGSSADEEGMTYRFVDPWEVEPLESRDAETRAATLGRSALLGFSLGKVSMSLQPSLRSLGDVPLLELWTNIQGGILLTKAIASLNPPWERAAGGHLTVASPSSPEASPYLNSIRTSLYRNCIFRDLGLPQRFVALIQVELLDLKNLTSPGGSLSLTVYSLLRLKRAGHGSGLTNKARTLDSSATQPVKLTKSSGPNAPASWGSVVRFRFPLPEDVYVHSTGRESNHETMFRGPPTFLQMTVYEKKLLVDHSLGSADVAMDGLWAGGQLEEWVPLRSEKSGISWFARIRLTLRFELMCAGNTESSTPPPSVGLRRIVGLSQTGGAAHEESLEKRSLSSPDLLSYFESMVY